MEFCALLQYLIRRLVVEARKVSKPRDFYLALSGHSEIWQAPTSVAFDKKSNRILKQSPVILALINPDHNFYVDVGWRDFKYWAYLIVFNTWFRAWVSNGNCFTLILFRKQEYIMIRKLAAWMQGAWVSMLERSSTQIWSVPNQISRGFQLSCCQRNVVHIILWFNLNNNNDFS